MELNHFSSNLPSICNSSIPEKRWDRMIDILKTKFLFLPENLQVLSLLQSLLVHLHMF